MANMPESITPEEVAQLDASYAPFPAFADWPQEMPRETVWRRKLDELELLANDVDDETLRQALEVAVRAAAFDTGAIEGLYSTNRGLTMTVATQAAFWERDIATHGTDVAAFFNAQLSTYELVLDVATRRLPVSEAWIRRLHEELTKPQETYTVHTPVGIQEQPLPRGEYKHYPNHVELPDGSRHSYAPVDRTRDEMARLIAELGTEAFEEAQSIIQAAYAHYALVAIHPFADGNGRVARALSSVYLYRAARIPLLVFADNRPTYFDALSESDTGNREKFVEFVNDVAIAAVELVADTVRTARGPSALTAASELRRLVTAQGGLTHTDIDGVATSLLTEFSRILSEEVTGLQLPNGVQASVGGGGSSTPTPPDNYRTTVTFPGQMVSLLLRSQGPATASRDAMFRIFVSKDLDEESDLYWILQEGTLTGATFSLADIQSGLTSVAEHRLRMLARRVLGVEMTELKQEAERALRGSGYVE